MLVVTRKTVQKELTQRTAAREVHDNMDRHVGAPLIQVCDTYDYNCGKGVFWHRGSPLHDDLYRKNTVTKQKDGISV